MVTLLEQAEGALRDRVRALVLAGVRRRGDPFMSLFSPANRADPYDAYAAIRRTAPVVRTPWGATTADHAAAERLLRHPTTRTATALRGQTGDVGWFQEWLFAGPDRGALVDPLGTESMIGLDGPEHGRLRRLVSKVFTPAAVEALRPTLTTIADRLVHEALRDDRFDLMTSIADVFPVLAICEVLGIPQADHRQFKAWGSALAADLDGMTSAPRERAATRALVELEAHLTTLVAQRRADPGDDLLSRLVLVEQDGEQLTDRELLATCMLLLVAGFETTVNLLGNGTLALSRNPEQVAWLRDDLPGRVGNAVEEMLRLDAPVQMVARFTGRPLTTDDGEAPPGTPVTVLLGGANRDPSVFADPDVLDLSRPRARRHLSFASGPHHCLGAALARLEGEVMFTALLERLAEVRLADRARRKPTLVLRGLETVPLVAVRA